MASLQVEMNDEGVRALLKSAEVQADLKRRADAISSAAGDGFEVEENLTKERARAVVITRTDDAKRAEATGRALTKALDAGR